MRKVAWWGAATAALVIGCAHTSAPDKVTDADLGRLQSNQMQPVERARLEQSRAQHELAQAKLGLQEAQQQKQRASADKDAANADGKRAQAEMDAANASREPQAMQQANRLNDESQLHKREAEAHDNFASKLIEERQAAVDAAQKRVDAAQARVEAAKLQALQQANVPAASKYDWGKMQSELKNKDLAAQDAQRKAQGMRPEVQTARQDWTRLRQQLQSRAPGSNFGGADMGTGSGSNLPPPSQAAPTRPDTGSSAAPPPSGTGSYQPGYDSGQGAPPAGTSSSGSSSGRSY